MKRIRLASGSSSSSSSPSTHLIIFEITSSDSSSAPQTVKYELDNAFFTTSSCSSTSSPSPIEIKLKYDPIHFPVTPSLLDRFAAFLTSLLTTNYLSTLKRLYSSSSSSSDSTAEDSLFPRVAWSAGLSETVGKENWSALLSVFDPPDYFEKAFSATTTNSSSSLLLLRQQQQQQQQKQAVDIPLQNGIVALSLSRDDCLNLHPAICDLLLWEISRRLRMCADSKEVQAEFYGDAVASSSSSASIGLMNSSELELQEAKAELCELIAPQIFETGDQRRKPAGSQQQKDGKGGGNNKSAVAELLSKDDDDDDDNATKEA